jgi:hypothetical protein
MGMRSSLNDVRDSIRGKISIKVDLSSHDLVVKIIWRKLYDIFNYDNKIYLKVVQENGWE